MKAWIVRIALLALLVLAATAFYQSRKNRPNRAELADKEGILLVGNGTDIETLDPHMATGQPEHWVITTLFEGLVAPAEDDPDKEAPGVALSWESPDLTRWTFKLRPEARWSDGVPITAEDFVYSWKRILSPDLGADYGQMLHLVKGAAAFNEGKTKDFSTVGVKAIDAQTLEVTLDGPAPYFPGMLKHYAWFPVPRHAVEKFGTMTQRDTAWARPGNLVCNGPFTLKNWRINHFIAVEKNPQYWDAAVVKLNEIHFFPIDNYETEERVFLDNQLHVTYTVPLAKVPVYRAKQPRDPFFKQSVELSVEFYKCNTKREPISNPKVRHALSLALDRETLLNSVIRSGHLPATGFVPPGSHPQYEAAKRLTFNPEEARRLLAEAGYPGGKGFKRIEILTNTSGTAKTVAEFFQESWRKHLGIEVGILQQEWQVYLDSMRKLNYDIARAGWVGDYSDPFTFLGCFRSTDGNNNTGWANPRYDEVLLASTREKEVPARMRMLHESEDLFLDELPAIPVFWRMLSHLERPELQNWKPSVLSHRCYKAISLGPYQPLPVAP
jgi:oligopeptide transport system substrate-binding protein